MAQSAKGKRMGRPPGQPKSGGREKGSLNRSTVSIRGAMLEAFEQLGGAAALAKWGETDPREFYKLVGRLVPVEVTGANGGPVEHEVSVWKFGSRKVSF